MTWSSQEFMLWNWPLPLSFISVTWENDNSRKGDTVDYTPRDLADIFCSKSICLKKGKIKESDADLDDGDCDVEGWS